MSGEFGKQLIVKMVKIEKAGFVDRLRISDESKKSFDVEYGAMNYLEFNRMLGNRIQAYFYASKVGPTLHINLEAPYQGW
jgi:hypothetical protein